MDYFRISVLYIFFLGGGGNNSDCGFFFHSYILCIYINNWNCNRHFVFLSLKGRTEDNMVFS